MGREATVSASFNSRVWNCVSSRSKK